MKIAVTGGAGMIGSNFIRFLNKKYPEAEVYLFDKIEDLDKKFNNIKDLKIKGSIRRAYELVDPYLGVCDFDYIFHFAANSSTDCSAQDAQDDYELTSMISENWKEKVIFASSAGVYGNDGHTPLTWYAFFKKKSEEEVLKNGGVAFRLFNVFGPGEELKTGQNSPLYRYTKALAKNEEIVMYDQNEKRDFVPVSLVCEDMGSVIGSNGKYSGQWFDVGTGNPLSFGEVFEYVKSVFKVQKRVVFGQHNSLLSHDQICLPLPEIRKEVLKRETQKNTCAKKFINDRDRSNSLNYYFVSFYFDKILNDLGVKL